MANISDTILLQRQTIIVDLCYFFQHKRNIFGLVVEFSIIIYKTTVFRYFYLTLLRQ